LVYTFVGYFLGARPQTPRVRFAEFRVKKNAFCEDENYNGLTRSILSESLWLMVFFFFQKKKQKAFVLLRRR
jgi:hypothetical protein